jgi:hypothetical protein
VTARRFPSPWTLEKIPGGFKVSDASGQSLAYVYSRENENGAHMAKVLSPTNSQSSSKRRGSRFAIAKVIAFSDDLLDGDRPSDGHTLHSVVISHRCAQRFKSVQATPMFVFDLQTTRAGR